MKPRLVISPMKRWEAKILNSIAWLIGLRGGSVGYCWLETTEEADENDIEVTLNDIVKNNEEDEMNKQTEKESGE